jgi:hypothetical protein
MNDDRSIFAVTLQELLQPFGYTIHSLRGKPFSLPGPKMDRLEASLTSLAFTGLNQIELSTITTFLKTTREQRMLLYAALIAMGSQRQLIDSFLPSDRAWAIALEVRAATHQWLMQHPSEDDLMRRQRLRRMGVGATVTSTAPGGIVLAEALDSFDEGVALHTLGLELDDATRLEAALLCYERALRLLATLAPSVQAGDDYQFWHGEILAQRDDVREHLA